MGTFERVRQLTSTTLNTPVVRSLRDQYYERQFTRRPGSFRGVFTSFEAATRATPKQGKVGYDHEEFATLYLDRHSRVFASDYPVLFWLERIFHEANSVFDFGGHIGVSYYAFKRYLQYPSGLSWRVCDVPKVIEAGRGLAAKQAASGLSFTSEFSELSSFDVLFAAGSLQYVETNLADKLRALTKLPRHVVVNKTPLRANGDAYVTLQNTKFAYNPYAVLNRDAFVRSLVGLGYELIDEWENFDLSCRIPLYPEHSLTHYKGLYMRLDPKTNGA